MGFEIEIDLEIETEKMETGTRKKDAAKSSEIKLRSM